MDAVIIRTTSDFNELEVVKYGTEMECLAYLADALLPCEDTRNVKTIQCDYGRMFSVEKKVYGQVIGGKWQKYKYMYKLML